MTNRREEQEALSQRIKRSREVAGLSQQEVADRLSLSRPTIADIEAGRRRVDSLLLRDLASLFGVAPWELLGPVDDTAQLMQLRKALFEEIGNAKIPPADREKIGWFWQCLDYYTWLRKEMKSSAPTLPDEGKRFTTHTPKYLIEAEADRMRDGIGLGNSPIKEDLRSLIEILGIPVFAWPFNSENLSGLFLNHPNLGPVLLINSNQVSWRQVFTLAHEFAHVWLHRHEYVIASRIFALEKDSREIETQANTFAAEFLMPTEGIKKALALLGIDGPLSAEDVVSLQRYFRVSYKAMLVRLLNLRMISKDNFEQFSQESPVRLALRLGYEVDSSEIGEMKVPPFYRQFPAEYVVLTLNAWQEGVIGEGKAAQMLGTDRYSLNKFVQKLEDEMRQQQSEKVPSGIGG